VRGEIDGCQEIFSGFLVRGVQGIGQRARAGIRFTIGGEEGLGKGEPVFPERSCELIVGRIRCSGTHWLGL
jgi:hypothetical protein